MKKFLEILGLLILLVGAVFLAKQLSAQTAPTSKAPAKTEIAPEVQALVAKEFGERFKIVADFPPMYGDFDGDGKPDLAVVATGDNPLMGEGSHGYKTLDPYNDSFGYGNPKVTMAFNTAESKARYILVLHSWQNPGKKFVLVNVPFEKLRLGHMLKKKKAVDAIEGVDATGVQSAIYFDGKKYKWEIIGSEVDR
jgi:hypothetical protein